MRRIQNDEGEWLDDQECIAKAIVNFFRTSLLKKEIMKILECLKNFIK